YKTSAEEITNGKPPYLLFLGYQDGSDIQAGDTITFNLTPDKNSTLAPIYSPVVNVQQLGESLNEKIDKEVEIIVDDKLPDIYDYSGKETITNKIAKFEDGNTKQVYRKIIDINYNVIRDGQYHNVSWAVSGYGFPANITFVDMSIMFDDIYYRKSYILNIMGGYIFFYVLNLGDPDIRFCMDYLIPNIFDVQVNKIKLTTLYYKN
ncbi:hypothetical protein R4J17_14430, partial [Brachyspira intermedia]